MLNYVWLALLVLGIGLAITTDIVDENTNKYRNGDSLYTQINFSEAFNKSEAKSYKVKLVIKPSTFNNFYGTNEKKLINQPAKLSFNPENQKVNLFFTTDENTPSIWREMAKVTGKENDLTGEVKILGFSDSTTVQAAVVFEKIGFAKMKAVTKAALDYAGIAVDISLGLIGIMALWLGVMKVAEEAGLIKIIANAVRPVTKFLFPDVPADHPAMGAMIMNISANMLGLGNAATPFGLKAMEELDKLNPNKGTATNAMCTFLTVNTAGLTLIPATAIAVRAAAGSSDPAIIIGTSIFGASCATITGITAAKILEKFSIEGFSFIKYFKENIKNILIVIGIIVALAIAISSGILSAVFGFVTPEFFKSIIQIISILAIPMLIFIFIGYGALKKVKVYEKFVEGAKEGFDVAVRIIPYLVAMLVAIGIFRAGGAMDFLVMILKPFTDFIGMPAEALPMAIMRPLSGSGSLGIMAEIIKVHGPDSFLGILVSTFFGSTETTFYVLAVYFGAVNIRRTRHALVAGLLADTAGILGALFIVKLLFGS